MSFTAVCPLIIEFTGYNTGFKITLILPSETTKRKALWALKTNLRFVDRKSFHQRYDMLLKSQAYAHVVLPVHIFLF